jgi:putative peptide zinc metalloprotease protein
VTTEQPEAVLGGIAEASQVQVIDLARRRDGDEWIVGRVDTGQFIAVPPVAIDVIDLLNQGLPVRAVRARLAAQTGTDLDIATFVASLADTGLVAAVDGHSLDSTPAPPPTFGWLRPRYVSWVLHPAVILAWAALCGAAAVCLIADPSLMPSRGDLVWSSRGSAVVLGNAALAWTILFLHELGHLVTARAAGVPGRMSLGTRLQFLVAQTDVTGVWASPRRVRLTVYLAGIAVNLAVAAGGLLVLAAHPGTPVDRVSAAAVLLSLLFIPSQAFVFMRTDLYFVLQDLAGCRDLYADAVAYGGYAARCGWHRLIRGQSCPDPSRCLSVPERRVVRAYSGFMVVGTVVCLAVAVMVTLPVVVTVLGAALSTLLTGAPAAETVDAAAVLVVTGGVQVLWLRAWWRKHGRRFRPLSRSQVSTEGR